MANSTRVICRQLMCLVLAGAAPVAAATLTVTTLGDVGQGSLRAAIAAAAPGDTVTFAPGLEGTITSSKTLVIDKDLTIAGPGASVLAIDGDLDDVFALARGAAATISGLTITNGDNGVANLGGELAVRGCVITDNDDAGMEAAGGTTTIVDTTVDDNNGAGIECGANCTLVVVNSAITNHSIDNGISNEGGTVRCVNCTLTENDNGMVNDYGGTLGIYNCTLAGNHNAAIQNDAGQVTIANSILALQMEDNCHGPITSAGYNLSDDMSCTAAFHQAGDRNGVAPGLGNLAANGGATQTLALLDGSPAIDAGAPSGCKDHAGRRLKTDQRGLPRPAASGGARARCDIGAFEFQPPPPRSFLSRLLSWLR